MTSPLLRHLMPAATTNPRHNHLAVTYDDDDKATTSTATTTTSCSSTYLSLSNSSCHMSQPSVTTTTTSPTSPTTTAYLSLSTSSLSVAVKLPLLLLPPALRPIISCSTTGHTPPNQPSAASLPPGHSPSPTPPKGPTDHTRLICICIDLHL